MKILFFYFLFFLLVAPAFAQVITLKDNTTQRPITEGFIELKSLDGVSILYIDIFENGQFKLDSERYKSGSLIISFFSEYYYSFSDTLHTLKDTTYYVQPDFRVKKLEEFVVTAQYDKRKVKDAVHSIKIISAETIQNMGAQNLRDVLTNQLNVRLGQDFALGSSMSLMGISGQNVKILIDGIPVTGRLNGNIDVSQINMNNVERIEVVEGPLSVSFGTDALAGTINIITKKGNEKDLSLNSSNYYESNGVYTTNFRFGLGNKKNQLSLDMGRYFFDGWNPTDHPFYYNSTPVADLTRFQEWKPKEQYYGTLNYRKKLKNRTIDLTSEVFNEEVINRGFPRAPYFTTAFDDYYQTQRINNSISSNGALGEKFKYTAFIAYNHFMRRKNTFFRDLTTIEDQLTQNPGDQDTSIFTNLMSRGSFLKSKRKEKFNYEIGYDINIETGSGPRILNEKQVIGDYALYSTAEIQPIQKLVLRSGLRLIHNTAYKAPLIPSINVKYTLIDDKMKKKALTIRSSYARGFRAPDLKELYFFFVDINHNIQGNPSLSAEESNNFTFALDYEFRVKKQPISLKLQGFYNSIENMISLAQSDGTLFSYFNIDRFRTTGLQFTNTIMVKNLSLNSGISYIGRFNELTVMSNEKPETFFFSPEGQFNLQYNFEKLNGSINLFYKYTGKLPIARVDENNSVEIVNIDAFHTLDLSIGKSFFNHRITMNLGIKNILDVTNINGVMPGGAHSGGGNSMAIGMGRTYFCSINFELSKSFTP